MEPGSDPNFDKTLIFTQGKTWGGVPYFDIKVNGAAPTWGSVVSCEWVIKENQYAPNALVTLRNASGVNILSSSGWTFQIPSRNSMPLNAGNFYWSFSIVDTTGADLVWMEGYQPVNPPIPVG